MHTHDLTKETNVKGETVYRCECGYAENSDGEKLKGMTDI